MKNLTNNAATLTKGNNHSIELIESRINENNPEIMKHLKALSNLGINVENLLIDVKTAEAQKRMLLEENIALIERNKEIAGHMANFIQLVTSDINRAAIRKPVSIN